MRIQFIVAAIICCVSCYSFAAIAYTNNKTISYNDVGQGAPLVLIHAFPTDQRLWAAQQEGLKAYFRVITLDLWGFGESSAVDGNAVTMGDYADEIKQLLDYLNLSKAIIAGESMGGYIAFAFLDKYPNQVAGLVLSNTQAIADNEEIKAIREKVASEILTNGADSFIKGFMSKALSLDSPEQAKLLLTTILSMQKSTAFASALRGMALRSDMTKLLTATPNLPILIITSDQDKIIPPKQSLDMHALAKNSQLAVIASAGHLSNLEQPQQWNEAIIEKFFSKKE